MRVALLDSSTWETKAGQRTVKDPEYWGMPYGTPIVAGMKPKGVRKPKGIVAQPVSENPKPKKVKTYPPYPEDDTGDGQYKIHKFNYEVRTSKPPRDSGDYEGMTAMEMWDDFADERKWYAPPRRHRESTGNGSRMVVDEDTRTRRDKKIGDAFVAYTSDEYAYINGALRMDEVATADLSSKEIAEVVEKIHLMDQGMRQVGKDIVVHRVTTASVFDRLSAGDQFRDRGFISTTVMEGYLDDVKESLYDDDPYVTQMEIRVPAKTRSMYLSALQRERNRDTNLGEGELLLDRGTEFRVIERNGSSLVLEVVLPDDPDATKFDDYFEDYTEALIKEKQAEEADEFGDEI